MTEFEKWFSTTNGLKRADARKGWNAGWASSLIANKEPVAEVPCSVGLGGLPDEAEVWQTRKLTKGNKDKHGTCECEEAIVGLPNTPNRWLCKTCGRWVHYNKRKAT